jgi:hypothetical protein
MRPLNIGVIEAKRLNMPVTSFRKRVNDVGTKIIGGGTRTKNAGIQNGIGMTTTIEITVIMMMTTAVSYDLGSRIDSSQQAFLEALHVDRSFYAHTGFGSETVSRRFRCGDGHGRKGN